MKKLSYIIIGLLIISNIFSFYLIHQKNKRIETLQSQEKTVQLQECEFELPNVRAMPIAAVSQDRVGRLGNVSLKLIEGNNEVLINTHPFVEADLQYSLNKAIFVAKNITGINYAVDYIVDYNADSILIGGGSAGAATTILVISALQNKTLKKEAVITGTIEPNGMVGRVGGLLEKGQAVADAGYQYFLVPEGQAEFTYYERVVRRRTFYPGLSIRNVDYVPKTIDLKEIAQEEWGLEVIEVSNIKEALPYFIRCDICD